HKQVAVTVDSDAPVELTLTLRYAQPGAGWTPFYEATLDPDSDQLVLDMFAWVRQSTGERWDDVRLTLATGAPSLGIDLPSLTSLVLRPLQPSVAGGFADDSERMEGLPIIGANYQDLLTLPPGVADPDPDGNPNVRGGRDTGSQVRTDGGSISENEPSGAKMPAPPHGNVVQKLALHSQADTGLTFDVPSRLTLDPDGQPRRVAISRDVLSARREYLVVPTVRPAAYLIAKVAAPADRPLLEGSVKHYIGSTLVGSSTLAPSAPGEQIVLSFGVDDRVKVDRPSRPGMTQMRGRDQIVQVERRAAITNRTGKPIAVAVKDRVPVSSHEDVRVSIAQETSAGHVEDGSAPGVLTWNLALSPDESREVTLAYAVRSPSRTPLTARR
ncbi:MAG TPA: DUF4139 domain-containing protein, partial [Candidatus Polarisedimenticolia bacterium]|nr:DUF4139 domain-containing protein [Candidatus Polarisedimenticolia bacterium]